MQLIDRFVAKNLYENNDEVVAKVLLIADKNKDSMFSFEELLRIHIALKYGKKIVDQTHCENLRKHMAVFICADSNYDNRVDT